MMALKMLPFLLSMEIAFIVLLVFAWLYRNPYRLIMVFGKKGSGKTTLIAKLSQKYLKKGIKVYSTVPVPGTYLFDVKEIGFSAFPEGCVIFIDEVGMIWDNRQFKSFMNEVRDYFKLQRHYKHTVYLFSQSFDVDIKLRNLTDCMYLTRTYFNVISVARRVNRSITIVHPSGEGESRIADDLEFAPLLAFWSIPVRLTWIPAWTRYFDSFDVPELKPQEFVLCPFPEDFDQRTLKYRMLHWFHVQVERAGQKVCGVVCQLRTEGIPFKCLEKTGEGTNPDSHPEDTQGELVILDLDLDDDLGL